jgi:hypothetical protein
MAIFDDTTLAAYLRGALDPAMMDRIDAALETDTMLAARLERLADADDQEPVTALVRDAFAPIKSLPIPDAMTAIVQQPEPAATNIVDFAAAASARRLPKWGWPQLGAMAASLAIGVVVGQGLLGGSQPAGSAIVVASAQGTQLAPELASFLDTAASGSAQPLGALGEAEVMISFRNGDGALCRQYLVKGQAGITDAVSCKANGQWSLEAMGNRAPPAGEIRTASGDAAAPVIAAVDALIASDVLVGADELAALKE